jgi:hypothetical protein
MKHILTLLFAALFIGTAYSQNVGIGTLTPNELLHIKNGNFKLEGDHSMIFDAFSGDTIGLRFRTAGIPYGSVLYHTASKILNISSHDTLQGLQYNFVSNKAFVGRNYQISPAEKFGITRNVTTADFGGMYIETKGHVGGKPFYGYALDGAPKAYHYFDGATDTWRLNALSDRLSVSRASGHVGIGVVAPADRLQVAGGDLRIEGATLPTLKLYQGATYAAYIQQSGDHTSFINKEAGNLILGTNDLQFMTIVPSGNIGIATNTPVDKLHILGNMRIDDANPVLKLHQGATLAASLKHSGTSTTLASDIAAGMLILRTANTDRMHVRNDGKVLIGRNTTISSSESFGLRVPVVSATFGGMYIETSGDAGGKPFYGYALDGAPKAFHYFDGTTGTWRLNAGGDRITVDAASGNLGIGNTDPLQRLHVTGNARIENTTPVLQLYQGATLAAFMQSSGNNFVLSNKLPGLLELRTNDLARLSILNNGNVDMSSSTFFLDAGAFRVGIGTAAPMDKMHVLGTLRIEHAGTPQLRFHKGATFAGFIQSTGDDLMISNKLPGQLRLLTNDVTRLAILVNGDVQIDGTTFNVNASTDRVGVGTSAPSDKLHVLGTMRIDDTNPLLKFHSGGISRATIDADASGNFTLDNKGTGDFEVVTNNNVRMAVQNDGDVSINGSTLFVDAVNQRVGIGTTTPSVKLSVNGTTRIDGTTFIVDAATNQVILGALTGASGYRLNVNGKIIAEELKVQLYANWPDYVFAPDYPLMSLGETRAFIAENGHLPGVPSAKQVTQEQGIELGEMNRILLEKVEQLTLYILEQEERIKRLETHINK